MVARPATYLIAMSQTPRKKVVDSEHLSTRRQTPLLLLLYTKTRIYSFVANRSPTLPKQARTKNTHPIPSPIHQKPPSSSTTKKTLLLSSPLPPSTSRFSDPSTHHPLTYQYPPPPPKSPPKPPQLQKFRPILQTVAMQSRIPFLVNSTF